jgi:hypothetical protein
MRFSRMKRKGCPGNPGETISKGLKIAFLVCGLLAFALLVSGGTMTISSAAASTPDEPSVDRVRGKTPPGMVWIPGGTFLMGTNDKES